MSREMVRRFEIDILCVVIPYRISVVVFNRKSAVLWKESFADVDISDIKSR